MLANATFVLSATGVIRHVETLSERTATKALVDELARVTVSTNTPQPVKIVSRPWKALALRKNPENRGQGKSVRMEAEKGGREVRVRGGGQRDMDAEGEVDGVEDSKEEQEHGAIDILGLGQAAHGIGHSSPSIAHNARTRIMRLFLAEKAGRLSEDPRARVTTAYGKQALVRYTGAQGKGPWHGWRARVQTPG